MSHVEGLGGDLMLYETTIYNLHYLSVIFDEYSFQQLTLSDSWMNFFSAAQMCFSLFSFFFLQLQSLKVVVLMMFMVLERCVN